MEIVKGFIQRKVVILLAAIVLVFFVTQYLEDIFPNTLYLSATVFVQSPDITKFPLVIHGFLVIFIPYLSTFDQI